MKSKIIENKLVRNILMVTMGTAGAQAITMIFSPIVTRLYGAESFGLLGTFTAIITVIIPLMALSYPIAIVLPKKNKDAEDIAKLSIYVSFIIFSLTTIIIILFGEDIALLLNITYLQNYLIFIPIALLFSSIKQVYEQWLIRQKLFKVSAKVALCQSLITNLSKTSLGWFFPSGFVLILTTSLGYLIYALLLILGVKNKNKHTISLCKFNLDDLKKIAYKYRDFPFYRAPQQFINALSQSLPTLMLASFFGPASVGFYALSRMVMGIPSTLIGKSVGDVFYPKVTEAVNKGENVANLLIKATASLALIGIAPFSVVMIFGPWLFAFIFGADWQIAGEYSQWLSLAMFFSFINRPAVATLATLRLQRFFLLYEIVSAIIRFIAIGLGFYFYKSDIVSIAAFSSAGMMLNTFLIFYTIIKSKAKK